MTDQQSMTVWARMPHGVIGGSFAARVEPDPLGPVNRIVRLMCAGEQVRGALARVGTGTVVSLGVGHPEGSDPSHLPVWRPLPPTVWFVEVDGRRVIEASRSEIEAVLRKSTPPPPPPPLWRRMRQALREQVRADVDAVAGRLGYHRVDECRGWDE